MTEPTKSVTTAPGWSFESAKVGKSFDKQVNGPPVAEDGRVTEDELGALGLTPDLLEFAGIPRHGKITEAGLRNLLQIAQPHSLNRPQRPSEARAEALQRRGDELAAKGEHARAFSAWAAAARFSPEYPVFMSGVAESRSEKWPSRRAASKAASVLWTESPEPLRTKAALARKELLELGYSLPDLEAFTVLFAGRRLSMETAVADLAALAAFARGKSRADSWWIRISNVVAEVEALDLIAPPPHGIMSLVAAMDAGMARAGASGWSFANTAKMLAFVSGGRPSLELAAKVGGWKDTGTLGFWPSTYFDDPRLPEAQRNAEREVLIGWADAIVGLGGELELGAMRLAKEVLDARRKDPTLPGLEELTRIVDTARRADLAKRTVEAGRAPTRPLALAPFGKQLTAAFKDASGYPSWDLRAANKLQRLQEAAAEGSAALKFVLSFDGAVTDRLPPDAALTLWRTLRVPASLRAGLGLGEICASALEAGMPAATVVERATVLARHASHESVSDLREADRPLEDVTPEGLARMVAKLSARALIGPLAAQRTGLVLDAVVAGSREVGREGANVPLMMSLVPKRVLLTLLALDPPLERSVHAVVLAEWERKQAGRDSTTTLESFGITDEEARGLLGGLGEHQQTGMLRRHASLFLPIALGHAVDGQDEAIAAAKRWRQMSRALVELWPALSPVERAAAEAKLVAFATDPHRTVARRAPASLTLVRLHEAGLLSSAEAVALANSLPRPAKVSTALPVASWLADGQLTAKIFFASARFLRTYAGMLQGAGFSLQPSPPTATVGMQGEPVTWVRERRGPAGTYVEKVILAEDGRQGASALSDPAIDIVGAVALEGDLEQHLGAAPSPAAAGAKLVLSGSPFGLAQLLKPGFVGRHGQHLVLGDGNGTHANGAVFLDLLEGIAAGQTDWDKLRPGALEGIEGVVLPDEARQELTAYARALS